MSIRFQCECGTKIRVPKTAAGKKGKCPGCKKAVLVPKSSPEISASDIKQTPNTPDTLPDEKTDSYQQENQHNSSLLNDSKPETPQPDTTKSISFIANNKLFISGTIIIFLVITTIAGIKISESTNSLKSQKPHVVNNDSQIEVQQQKEEPQNNIQVSENEVIPAQEIKVPKKNKPAAVHQLSGEAQILQELMDIHRDYYSRMVYHRAHVVDVRKSVLIQEDVILNLSKLLIKINIRSDISSKFKELFNRIMIFNQANLLGHAQFASIDLKNADQFKNGVMDTVGPKNDFGGVVRGFLALKQQSALMKFINKFREEMVPRAKSLQEEWNELVRVIVKDYPQLKAYAEDPEICTPVVGVFLPTLEIPKEKIGVVYPIKEVSYPNPYQLGEIHKPVMINIGPHNKSWHYIFYFKCNKKKTPVNYKLSGIQGDVCMRMLVSAGAGQYSDGINITVTGTPGKPPHVNRVIKEEVKYQKAPFVKQFVIPHKAGYLLVLSHAHRPGFGPSFSDTGAKVKIWTDDNPEPNLNTNDIRVINISGDPKERFTHYEKELAENSKVLRDNISLEKEFAGYIETNYDKFPFYIKPKVNPETGKITGKITWLQFDPKETTTSNINGELIDNRFKFNRNHEYIQKSSGKKKQTTINYFVDYKATKNREAAQGYTLPIRKNHHNSEIFIQFDRTRSTINEQILTAMEKAKAVNIPFKGVARGSYQRWPFRMMIKSVVKERGVFTGEIDWISLGSIHKFTGKVSKGIITFKETKAIKKGKALLGCEYHLEVHDDNSMHGSFIYKLKKQKTRKGFAGRRKKNRKDNTVSLFVFSELK